MHELILISEKYKEDILDFYRYSYAPRIKF